MLSTIWSDPDLSEVFFLLAVILLGIELLIRITRPANWPIPDVFLVGGLFCMALGWLAF